MDKEVIWRCTSSSSTDRRNPSSASSAPRFDLDGDDNDWFVIYQIIPLLFLYSLLAKRELCWYIQKFIAVKIRKRYNRFTFSYLNRYNFPFLFLLLVLKRKRITSVTSIFLSTNRRVSEPELVTKEDTFEEYPSKSRSSNRGPGETGGYRWWGVPADVPIKLEEVFDWSCKGNPDEDANNF